MTTVCGDELCGGLSNVLMSQQISGNNAAADVEEAVVPAAATVSHGRTGSSFFGLGGSAKDEAVAKEEGATEVDPESDATGDNEILATVFMISGCQDSQTSADISNVANFSLPDPNGKAGGACTSALLKGAYFSV